MSLFGGLFGKQKRKVPLRAEPVQVAAPKKRRRRTKAQMMEDYRRELERKATLMRVEAEVRELEAELAGRSSGRWERKLTLDDLEGVKKALSGLGYRVVPAEGMDMSDTPGWMRTLAYTLGPGGLPQMMGALAQMGTQMGALQGLMQGQQAGPSPMLPQATPEPVQPPQPVQPQLEPQPQPQPSSTPVSPAEAARVEPVASERPLQEQEETTTMKEPKEPLRSIVPGDLAEWGPLAQGWGALLAGKTAGEAAATLVQAAKQYPQFQAFVAKVGELDGEQLLGLFDHMAGISPDFARVGEWLRAQPEWVGQLIEEVKARVGQAGQVQ